MPQVVDGELQLAAGPDAGLRAGHDAGVVDQDVGPPDGRGERGHLRQVGQVEPPGLDAGQVERGRVADPGDDGGPGPGEGGGAHAADPGGGPGHDRGAAGQVHTGEDVGGGGGGVECHTGGR
ncbi:hypothetical protein GCM10020218_066250 [Dactylosporangium vinaceum]